DEAEREIAQSRQRLVDILGAPVDLFAYPNGRPGRDYTARDVAIVRRLGVRAAVSTRPAVASEIDDPFEIPRFTPWDR
ncbi:polysaccharide deacetylase family protein, partial [Acinetobacter baumannii]